jgi:3-deoxy-D-arabino-heptulosonate 7-phosphate (DAHP) synthase
MMVTRTNPFDHATYDQLISNNLKGEIDFEPLMQSSRIDGKRKLRSPVARFIQLMLTVDAAERPFASELLEIYKKQFIASHS